jgi:hypothetical protein
MHCESDVVEVECLDWGVGVSRNFEVYTVVGGKRG